MYYHFYKNLPFAGGHEVVGNGINDSNEENSEESIIAVTVIYKISVKEKNTTKEFINILTDNVVWENILFSGFDVKEDTNNFIVEVLYSRDDFPEVFTVARAVSILESLPWPQNYIF